MTMKKFEWRHSTSLAIKLRNQGLDDLHRVLQATSLKSDVAKTRLHVDVHEISSGALKKDF